MKSSRLPHGNRRRVFDSLKQKPPQVFTPREQSTSAYRLSRVPAKFSQNKSFVPEKNQSFAENYFSNHPNEEIDKRPIEEKFSEVESLLKNAGSTEEEKLHLYIKEKILNLIKFGENSIESYRSFINIGICYSRIGKYVSAIRNFNKAKSIESAVTPTDNDIVIFDIETTEAHLVMYSQFQANGSTTESSKHLKTAENTISRIKNVEIKHPELRYRRDLSVAHILSTRNKFSEAMPFFLSGIGSYEEACPDLNVGLPKLCVQAAENAALIYDDSVSANRIKNDNYRKAYDLFLQLDMKEDAAELEPFLQTDDHQNTDKPNESKENEEYPDTDGHIYQTKDDRPNQYKADDDFSNDPEPNDPKLNMSDVLHGVNQTSQPIKEDSKVEEKEKDNQSQDVKTNKYIVDDDDFSNDSEPNDPKSNTPGVLKSVNQSSQAIKEESKVDEKEKDNQSQDVQTNNSKIEEDDFSNDSEPNDPKLNMLDVLKGLNQTSQPPKEEANGEKKDLSNSDDFEDFE